MLSCRNHYIHFKISLLVGLSLAFGLPASAQITVTAPAANQTIKAADDFATEAFQDPWDMNKMTDLGWFTYSVDAPVSCLTNIVFSGGIFSATTVSNTAACPSGNTPNFMLLDPNSATATQLGKVGTVYPIDSTKYQRFLIRMNLPAGLSATPNACGLVDPTQCAQLIWNLYGATSTSHVIPVYSGWWIYAVDLPSLGVAAGQPWTSSNPVQSLRFGPIFKPNINFSVDWARLTNYDNTLDRTITWTGSGQVDIFLDNDTNFGNGYVGQIATGVTGNSYTFNVGGLPAGTYYVAIRPTAGGTAAYSAGAWTVNDIPTLTFTSPNPQGSSDDFATTQLSNPWDMNATSDIDFTLNVGTPVISSIPAQDEAGNSLGSVRVYSGTTSGPNASNFNDPEIYPLHWTVRGANTHIDTSRYRILTLKWGINRARDINSGSIGRVVWRVFGETLENVSSDIILRHLGTANVIQTVIADMKSLPLAWGGSPAHFGGGSPSTSGWNGMLDGFRIKPDEFSNATNFYVESVKLTAFEQADTSYTVQWSYTNAGTAAPTVQLYWDSTGTGFSLTNQIVSGLNPTTGSYVWNTTALPNGTYYIFARIMNGLTVMNETYARWPINIIHGSGSLPTLTLDRSHLYFGATNNGTTVTSAQIVHVTTPSGIAWTASSNQPFATVSPTSGTGSGTITVTVQSSTFPSPSTQNATITVSAAGATNSPQTVQVAVNVINPSATLPPFGSFDTPATNTTGIAGAIPVTGWALDGIQTISVEIWREPLPGETPQANGLIDVGTATFVDGARPDVAATYSTYPLNTRGGWGYMLLTNFLPNHGGSPGPGNGTYNLHAIATNSYGQTTDLGVKAISVNNAAASKPFGTIDTPAQGGTASGNAFVNFGWTLTQNPNCIPIDGSTITVYVDSVALGHPNYNQPRSDISTFFPGRCNSNGAVGFFYINTTTLTDGVHTISWVAYDNVGHGDGLGSRYFTVFNGGPTASPADAGTAAVSSAAIATPAAVTVRRGLDLGSVPEALITRADGAYSVTMEELGRIELQIGAVRGYQIINGEAHHLPIGSTLKDGVFYWAAGPGFLGRYELRFEKPDGSVAAVHVNIQPITTARRGARQ
jgi:hypothetical protein